MKKLLLTIMITALTLTVLTGCSSKQNANPSTDTTSNADDTDNTSELITIKHEKGTTEVVRDIKKAVVFDFGVLDTFQTLDIEVELAAPVDSLPEYLSGYSTVVNAGGIKEPNLEVIFAFAPDVIFISSRQESYYEQLSEIAPTIYVNINAVTYMEDFTQSVTNIATLFDRTEEAMQLLNQINIEVDETKALTSQSEENALILLTNDGSLSVFGPGSRFGIIHDLLGVKTADAIIDSSTHGQGVGFEYISEINPDILFVVDRTAVVGGTNLAAATLDNDLVKGTKAAVNNKIISLDPDIWYLSGGGLTSVSTMIEDIRSAFHQ